jgi:hypothetical protein
MFINSLYRKNSTNKKGSKRITSRYKNNEGYIQIIAFLFFISAFLVLIFGIKTLVSWRVVSWIYVLFVIFYSVILKKFLNKKISKVLKILFITCGLSPISTGLFLVLNFYVYTNKTKEAVKITNFEILQFDNIIFVELEDTELNKHIEIRKFDMDKYNFKPDSAIYIIKKGIFGLRTVSDTWLKK